MSFHFRNLIKFFKFLFILYFGLNIFKKTNIMINHFKEIISSNKRLGYLKIWHSLTCSAGICICRALNYPFIGIYFFCRKRPALLSTRPIPNRKEIQIKQITDTLCILSLPFSYRMLHFIGILLHFPQMIGFKKVMRIQCLSSSILRIEQLKCFSYSINLNNNYFKNIFHCIDKALFSIRLQRKPFRYKLIV